MDVPFFYHLVNEFVHEFELSFHFQSALDIWSIQIVVDPYVLSSCVFEGFAGEHSFYYKQNT